MPNAYLTVGVVWKRGFYVWGQTHRSECLPCSIESVEFELPWAHFGNTNCFKIYYIRRIKNVIWMRWVGPAARVTRKRLPQTESRLHLAGVQVGRACACARVFAVLPDIYLILVLLHWFPLSPLLSYCKTQLRWNLSCCNSYAILVGMVREWPIAFSNPTTVSVHITIQAHTVQLINRSEVLAEQIYKISCQIRFSLVFIFLCVWTLCLCLEDKDFTAFYCLI